LLRPSTFHELVSGRRRGLAASTLRLLLRVAEGPYAAAMRVRNRRYDRASAVHRVGVPVVSVGNLTLGGTGKTPMVRWIARRLAGRGVRVAIVSRGYGRKKDRENDEALELAHALPDVPHLQNPDRVAAAREAVERFGASAIVLDDAFQHRRIGRDLDVVLLDASEPFGYGHVFPRGTLREPLAGLGRADVVVLSRADLLGCDERDAIRQEVRRLAPGAGWVAAVHTPETLLSPGGRQQPIDSLRGERVAAFCGIGNPAGFRHTLESCGYRVAGFREFADHHRYTPGELDALADWAAELDASALLCTHKDLVKLDAARLGPPPLWAVVVGVDFLSGRDLLESRLNAAVRECGRRPA
jgi:tetraacyldisaccharide 4'-kinase